MTSAACAYALELHASRSIDPPAHIALLASCADDIQKGLRPRRAVRQAMAHGELLPSPSTVPFPSSCTLTCTMYPQRSTSTPLCRRRAWASTSASRTPRLAWRATRSRPTCWWCRRRHAAHLAQLHLALPMKTRTDMLSVLFAQLLLYMSLAPEEKIK